MTKKKKDNNIKETGKEKHHNNNVDFSKLDDILNSFDELINHVKNNFVEDKYSIDYRNKEIKLTDKRVIIRIDNIGEKYILIYGSLTIEEDKNSINNALFLINKIGFYGYIQRQKNKKNKFKNQKLSINITTLLLVITMLTALISSILDYNKISGICFLIILFLLLLKLPEIFEE
ncbi:MAG: hypothetical protein MJ211_13800 [Bacteroidales bacterium]|nr:hypothetical protein [Bacteroidales bacterium]